MKISTLEKSSQELKRKYFSTFDDISVTIGLKCLVVCIHKDSWEGELPPEFNGIQITYVFGVPRRYLSFTM